MDHRVRHRLPPLDGRLPQPRDACRSGPPGDADTEHAVLNPLRSEGEAFRVLLYVLAVVAVIVIIVLGARAIF